MGNYGSFIGSKQVKTGNYGSKQAIIGQKQVKTRFWEKELCQA